MCLVCNNYSICPTTLFSALLIFCTLRYFGTLYIWGLDSGKSDTSSKFMAKRGSSRLILEC